MRHFWYGVSTSPIALLLFWQLANRESIALFSAPHSTEALAAVLRFGFSELGLNKIYATHIAGNPASGQVMLKNAMLKEGELVQRTKREDQYHDL